MDPNSLGSPASEFRTKHFHVDWTVDFAKRSLDGHVELEVDRIDASAQVLRLDTNQLTVIRVFVNSSLNYDWKLGEEVKPFGRPLEIPIPKGKSVSVRVDYETSKDSTALQWLEERCGSLWL
jgi:leukotriene-A4 hydrolase